MRKGRSILVLALTLALLGSSSYVPMAAGKPKANQVCTKKNEVRALKNITLKCTKVGKKLIWKVRKSQSSNDSDSTPEALPSPAPTPTPKPSPSESASNPKNTFTPPTNRPKTIAELDPETAWYFAWESMNEYRKKNELFKAKYDIRISSNYKTDVRDVIIEGLDAGSSFWSDFWKPTQPIIVILGTEKDTEFWRAELAALHDPRWQQSKDEMFNYLQESFKKFGAYNNSAGASWFGNKANMNFPYGSALQANNIRANNWQTSPHEYTHIVQGVLGYAFNLNGMGTSWMSEGQAEHVGLFLTHSDPQMYLDYRNLRFRGQWRSPDQSELRTPNQIHEAIRDGAQKPIYNAYYSYGAAAIEALVAIHGHGSIIEYFKRIQSGVWWPVAFQQIFGMTHEQYIRDVSVYLAKLRSHLTGEPIPQEVVPENLIKYLDTKKKAYESINSKAVSQENIKFNFKYMIGDSFPEEFKAISLKQIPYSASIFSYFLDKKIDTTIYLYTEKEDTYVRNLPLWKNNQYWADNQIWFDRWKQGIAYEHNAGLAAWYLVDPVNYGGHAGIAAPSYGTMKTQRYYNIQTLPHEFFHVIQDYHFRTRNVVFPNSISYDLAFPPLFREGSANTFSIAVTFDKFDDYLNFYTNYANDMIPNNKMLKEIKSESDVIAVLKRSMSRTDQEAWHVGYFTGALLFEWFIAEYGVDKYRQLLIDPAYGGNFDELLKKVVGYDSNELFKRAALHVLTAIQGQ